MPEGPQAGFLCEPGQSVPDDCPLLSGGSGPSLIELPHGSIYIAPDSRLRIKARGAQLVLASGRILVLAQRPMEVAVAGGLKIELGGQCSVEVTAERDKPVEVWPIRRTSLEISPNKISMIRSGSIEEFGHMILWQPATAASSGGVKVVALDVSQPRERLKRLEAWIVSATPAQGLGQLVVKDSQSGSPVRLNVARYHAHVVLQPPAALVQIDQSFYNPYDRQEEGTFVFSLPRGASVSRFAMYVEGLLVEGEVVERQRAAGVYQSIVSRQRDPAILEQIGDNLFKMRVFPIFPKAVKRILLDYTVPLEAVGGACSFRLPLFSDLQADLGFPH